MAVIFFLVFLVFYIYLLDLIVIRRDFATSKKAIKAISEIIKSRGKQSGIFFDLGSSRGWLIFGVLKYCPNLTAVGIDDNNLRIWLSRVLSKILNRPAKFLKNDVFKANVSSADVIYVFLDQSVMPALEQKLQKELKPGAIVITNTQYLPTWPTLDVFITRPEKPAEEKLYLYVKR